MNKKAKLNYGIDTPIVVINLFVFSIIQSGFVLLTLKYLASYSPSLFYGSLLLNGLGATYCLLTALLMILSSKILKPLYIKRLFNTLKISPSAKVLDIGCGSGLLSIEAAKKLTTGKVYALDMWSGKEQTQNRQENFEKNAEIENVKDKIEIAQADMRQIPYEDGYFDTVISCLAIHNIEDRDERQIALEEIYRVLKPSGTFYLLDFIYTKQYAEYLKALGSQEVAVSKRIWSVIPFLKMVSGRK